MELELDLSHKYDNVPLGQFFEKENYVNDLFRGHIGECVSHLANRMLEVAPMGSARSKKNKTLVATFCKAKVHTVEDWFFRTKHLPAGEKYIKLMCFLDLNGYKVIEFERMTQKCRNFAKLIAFDVVTTDQAVEMLGYNQPSELFAALRGTRGMYSDREEKLWDLWKARKDQLDHAVEEASHKFCLKFSGSEELESEEASSDLTSSGKSNNCPRNVTIDVMQLLLKLLDGGVLQGMSKNEWDELRSSSSMVLRLSSHLSTLSAKLVK